MDRPQRHGDTENIIHRRRDPENLDGINVLTRQIIGCAIEVHRELGPGLLETMYEDAMCIEMEALGIRFERQVALPAYYKGRALGAYRVDLIVNDLVVVEIKSVERANPVFEAQLLTYLRLTGKRVGLLINFNNRWVKDGIKRLIV